MPPSRKGSSSALRACRRCPGFTVCYKRAYSAARPSGPRAVATGAPSASSSHTFCRAWRGSTAPYCGGSATLDAGCCGGEGCAAPEPERLEFTMVLVWGDAAA